MNSKKTSNPKHLLIRNVPKKVKTWIDREKKRQYVSQQQLLIGLLENAMVNHKELEGKSYLGNAFKQEKPLFTFADFFAGIGGFRIALQKVGGHCVFSSEWDKYAQKTYKSWFGETPAGDIRKIKPADVPKHDILAAGFPCQPFSIAGVSKKLSLGMEHGFSDIKQGNLFFYLANIAEAKRPAVLFLENVKNLKSHDGGKTWDVINGTLVDLGYKVFHKIIDAAGYVPQHRERIFIVCFDKRKFGENPPFEFPETPIGPPPKLRAILETAPDEKYILTDHLWKYLRKYADSHRERGNGFGFGIADIDGKTRTISARYYKDGSEILISRGNGLNPSVLSLTLLYIF